MVIVLTQEMVFGEFRQKLNRKMNIKIRFYDTISSSSIRNKEHNDCVKKKCLRSKKFATLDFARGITNILEKVSNAIKRK